MSHVSFAVNKVINQYVTSNTSDIYRIKAFSRRFNFQLEGHINHHLDGLISFSELRNIARETFFGLFTEQEQLAIAIGVDEKESARHVLRDIDFPGRDTLTGQQALDIVSFFLPEELTCKKRVELE